MIGTITVVLEVGLIVLHLVADQVVQSKPVVTGNEVHAGLRSTAGLEQVTASSQARCEIPYPSRAPPPEVPYAIPVLVVPFAPSHRKTAGLIASRAQVPGLRDEFHPRQAGIL